MSSVPLSRDAWVRFPSWLASSLPTLSLHTSCTFGAVLATRWVLIISCALSSAGYIVRIVSCGLCCADFFVLIVSRELLRAICVVQIVSCRLFRAKGTVRIVTWDHIVGLQNVTVS